MCISLVTVYYYLHIMKVNIRELCNISKTRLKYTCTPNFTARFYIMKINIRELCNISKTHLKYTCTPNFTARFHAC
jgi:hypothetical protein